MPNSLTFNVQCQSEIVGQYLTIQLMSYSQLRLDEVKVYPEPGKIFFPFQCVSKTETRQKVRQRLDLNAYKCTYYTSFPPKLPQKHAFNKVR